MSEACPFCGLPSDRVTGRSQHAVALLDGYPVADGHSLVIPTRHVGSIFDLDESEYLDLWRLVRDVRRDLAAKYGESFNVGVNDGIAAGQTVMHAHVHVIPRVAGDVDDPRGGVRWIFPDRAAYWTER